MDVCFFIFPLGNFYISGIALGWAVSFVPSCFKYFLAYSPVVFFLPTTPLISFLFFCDLTVEIFLLGGPCW